MSGTFTARIAELRDRTHARDGRLRGEVIVDQIYAHYQHEGLNLNHPRGGQALYLRGPLMLGYRYYLDDYARTVLEDGGIPAMKRSMEDLAGDGGVGALAPREFGDLRKSGHPRVLAGDRIVYDRPPERARLTEAELRAKSRLRRLPPQLAGWIWWHVMHREHPPTWYRNRGITP